MSKMPENRNEVDSLVDNEQMRELKDSEYERLKTEIGDRIKRRRKELGYTRDDVSKMTGLAVSTITFQEQGRSAPNLDTLLLLCEALEVSSDYIIGLRNLNFDDVMRDAKTAHVIRMLLKFPAEEKEEVLWFIQARQERMKSQNIKNKRL